MLRKELIPLKGIHDFVYFLGGIATLTGRTVFAVFAPPMKRERIFEQAKKAGLDSLPIVSLISFFLGMIMAFQISYLMRRLGAEMYIANVVSLSIVRELGPVITALIIAGRVGASITAEIGSMQVTEQVDALETLATDPVKYLVVPRYVALTVMLPILTLYADLIGILGGWLIAVFKIGISSRLYLNTSFEALQFKDLFTGLAKTVFFGMIISLVSCYEGFNVQGGAEGVGRATTRCVVTSFIMIIICDTFFTALFYFIFP
ncbi:MAG: MlaE family ABC transporter permease [Deltaproteobacteria bacterium]